MGTNNTKPLMDLAAKEPVFGLGPATQLLSEPSWREEQDRNLTLFEHPAFPREPNIELKDSR